MPTFLPDPPHGWNDGHAAFNNGRYDQWVPDQSRRRTGSWARAGWPVPTCGQQLDL
jgi:phospholipase C